MMQSVGNELNALEPVIDGGVLDLNLISPTDANPLNALFSIVVTVLAISSFPKLPH